MLLDRLNGETGDCCGEGACERDAVVEADAVVVDFVALTAACAGGCKDDDDVDIDDKDGEVGGPGSTPRPA